MENETDAPPVVFWVDESNQFYAGVQSAQIAIAIPGVVLSSLLLHTVSHAKGKFRLFALLAIGDMLYCLSEICDSTFRLAMLIELPSKPYTMKLQFTPRLCLLFPQVHFFVFCDMWSPWITFAISLERALSVFRPGWYNAQWKLGYGKTYAKRWALFVVAYGCLGYPIIWFRDHNRLFALRHRRRHPAECYAAALITFLAVGRGKSILSDHGGMNSSVENRLNRTATAVVLTTLILDMIPSLMMFAISSKLIEVGAMRSPLFAAFNCIRMTNSVINLPLYLIINKDFRNSARNVFTVASTHEATTGGHSQSTVK